ncbi:MAG: hypothetical protein HYV07_18835 [Deltaproteobacteria bacterium]|nr:hypothetical protein [Deltaproteobacteria bacterium]
MRTALVALVLCSPAPAAAEDFFANSPGPLSEAHAELDNRDGCGKCHELGRGVTNLLCLDCHTHEPLKDAIARKEGLHATFGKKACRTCHVEHKGRVAATSDWGPIGGRAAFDHDKTSFSLANQHAKVACTKCHKRKLKSGRSSYIGLKKDCNGCHENPHAMTSEDLIEKCTDCHGAKGGIARKMKPADLPFDHEKRTGTALTGKHAKLDCVKCHAKGRMAMRDERRCASCHDSPHGPGWAKSACQKCHGVAIAFTRPTFDHDRDTKFPLEGKHKTKKCSQCHETRDTKPEPVCASCHKDPHKRRFEKVACEKCHGKGGDPGTKSFDHDGTGFVLTGKHDGVACRDCHRGKGPTSFEKLGKGTECMSCHRHENAHQKQFDDKKCVECHSEGGSRTLVFDHQSGSRFKLTGFHLELGGASVTGWKAPRGSPKNAGNQCEKCHPKGQFRTNKLACADCHEDSHKGELGKLCEKCHATDTHYKESSKTFDHDTKTEWPLEKKHEKAECRKCHQDRKYKTGKTRCIDCHRKDDPHEEKLGDDCARCHVPDKGAPKFVHEDMTSFVRTGAHLRAECTSCHRPAPKTPPPRGWTKSLPKTELARTFPVMGKVCADCHEDPHGGSRGRGCESCHSTTDFAETSAAVHDTGSFRLAGTHDILPCGRCHLPELELEGLGERCDGCHREDDSHDQALGPFCGECHSQIAWVPARFDHARTGYPLRGAHRTAPCTDCHSIGSYAGTPTLCETCHAVDASRPVEPIHGNELTDCAPCHLETSFRPARRYHPWWPLNGVHLTIRCGDCHSGGAYAGTPDLCFACHEVDYVSPRNEPDHVREGYATTCEDCHATATWKGARRP